MATIATNVRWTSASPAIYFDFSYEKQRVGSTQQYKITVSCRGLLTTSSYYGYPIKVEISLDGALKAAYTLKDSSPQYWSSPITNTTAWLDVANKTTGDTGISIRIYCDNPNSDRDVTYKYALGIDPAASEIKCSGGDIGSNPTILITRYSNSFTHTVKHLAPNGVDWVVIAEKTTDTTITKWTIPEEFYAKIPNGRTTPVWLQCVTYSGNTVVGTNNCMFSATTNEAKCKPTVSGSVIDINPKTTEVTGDPNILVRFCSTAQCVIDVTLNKGAGSILTKTINNVVLDADKNTLEIPNVETDVFDFYAKDSREYYNTDKEPKTLVPYVKLTANVTAQRTDPTSGNATLTIEGNYFRGSFGKSSNHLEVRYRQGSSGDFISVTPIISETEDKYSVEINLSELDYKYAFNYEIEVEDAISTVPKTATILKGIPVFDWGENDFCFNVPVTINGINILEKLAELERRISTL